jgi:predicted enzyme related to lactoylglutathione lyase
MSGSCYGVGDTTNLESGRRKGQQGAAAACHRDVDEFVRKAERLGAKVMMPKQPVPSMGWFAQLSDPEGNVFAIWQPDPSAAPARPAASEKAGKAGR